MSCWCQKSYTLGLILLFFLVLPSCDEIPAYRTVVGNGDRLKIQRSAYNFEHLVIENSMDVVYESSDEYSLEIEGDENILNYIESSREDIYTLNIQYKDGVLLQSSRGIKVYVKSPELKSVKMFSGGSFFSDSIDTEIFQIEVLGNTRFGCNKLRCDSLDAKIVGSGNIELKMETEKVDCTLNGSGNIYLGGKCSDLHIDILGAGKVKCYGLTTLKADFSIVGSGIAFAYAQDLLLANIDGSGVIFYKGNAILLKEVHGDGKVINDN